MKQTLVGRVIASFGRHLLVREPGGREVRARPFGRSLTVVCGDEVRCRLDARHDEVHVVEVLPRRTALYRANLRGGAEPVVANLTRLLVVLAPLPAPRSEEHTSELQSQSNLVCRLLLEKKKQNTH